MATTGVPETSQGTQEETQTDHGTQTVATGQHEATEHYGTVSFSALWVREQ